MEKYAPDSSAPSVLSNYTPNQQYDTVKQTNNPPSKLKLQ